jgi:ATP-binding cassette subfamily C exporter for protease/lipase
LGYLPQDVALFDGTLRENISRFGEFNQDEYRRVVSLTGLEDLFHTLPNGDITELGPSALNLSGGQRQRVGLARALYGSPALIVLDEPNSNLDQRGDDVLAAALKSERNRGATIILITHRTEIVSIADRVLILKEGRQAAFGPANKMGEVFQHLTSRAQSKKLLQSDGDSGL